MKSYLSLIPVSARVRRRQNRMTVLCISISVFLVTMIFSMADMGIRMETERMIEKHGNWHIMLKEPSGQQLEDITRKKEVKSFSRYDGLNYDLSEDYTIHGRTCVIAGGDGTILTEIYNDISEGSFPSAENEILLSNRARDQLSLKIGDSVTLHTPKGEYVYTISGFGGDVTIADDVDVLGAFLNWESFIDLAEAEESKLEPVCFVRFHTHTNIRKVIAGLRESYGFTEEELSENTALLGLIGFSSDSYMMGMYLVAAILFVLVLTAGIFMIAGSLNSRTAERTQFFGMLRCIGASRAQVMRIVRLEALYWCRMAIPLGVITGIAGTWALCALLRFGAGSEFVKIPVMRIVRLEALYWCRMAIPLGVITGIAGTWALCALLRFGAGSEFVKIPLFGISGIGILSGMIVGILTVSLSSIAPARAAAGISPIAAVSGNLNEKSCTVRPVRRSLFKIETALGIHHAVSSRKNLFLMTGSFALSIMMILSFSVCIQWFNTALNPLKPWAPDVFYVSPDNQCEIDKGFAEEVEMMILSFSVCIQWFNTALNPLKPWAPDVFYVSPDNQCEIDKGFAEEVERRPYVERVFGRMYQSFLAEYEEKTGQIDLISYEEQQFHWAEKDLLEGDLEAVMEGRGVLTVYDKSNSLKTGDIIRLAQTELTVAGVLEDSPFDTTEQPTVICSEKLFHRLTGQDGYSVLDIQLTKGASEREINELYALPDGKYEFYDRTAQNQDVENTYFMFCLFVYGFLGVIILITIIHTVNSISMSVSARIKQYGAMRAVGMARRQVRKMIFMETVSYTGLGFITGCVLGLPLHCFLYRRMITHYWGILWRPPLTSLGGILALLALISLLASFAPAKRTCNITITSAISEL